MCCSGCMLVFGAFLLMFQSNHICGQGANDLAERCMKKEENVFTEPHSSGVHSRESVKGHATAEELGERRGAAGGRINIQNTCPLLSLGSGLRLPSHRKLFWAPPPRTAPGQCLPWESWPHLIPTPPPQGS